MTGVVHQIEMDASLAVAGLEQIAQADLDTLVYSLGQLVETQTKTRINDEKTAPDGTPWAPWSAGYAASLQRPNRIYPGSLLLREDDLRDSITNVTSARQVEVGSNLVYAAIHQFGGDTSRGHPPIPARPYLGLSQANREEVEDLVKTFVEGVLQ